MEITEDQAAILFNLVLQKLTQLHAEDVISGIDESRRLGMEETVVPLFESPINRAELRSLGTVRRRPPSHLEMLRIAIQRIRQRLIVIPALAQRLEKEFGTDHICWRVDESFISNERAQNLEASLTDLRPHDAISIEDAYRRLHSLIPDAIPDVQGDMKDG